MKDDGYAEWSILELMGHRRLGGFVTEEERFGTTFLRIDIATSGANVTTQYYGPNSIYCLTPTTEDIAKGLAESFDPPVHRYELAQLPESVIDPCDPDSENSF